MKKMNFFLTSRKVGILFLLNSFLFFFGSYFLFLITMLVSLIILFFYRKNPSIISERQLSPTNLVYSPVNGIVEKIEDQSLFIRISLLNECGVYAPFKCEAKQFIKGPNSQILIANDKENEIRLLFEKTSFGSSPRFWLETQDRAKCGASIGYKPFGGLIKIELKGDASIISKIGHQVLASQTIIGQFKDLNDK